MKKKIVELTVFFALTLLVLNTAGGCGKQLATPQQVGPDNPKVKMSLAWYRQAKLGMFVHWGLYSIEGKRPWSRFRDQIPDNEYRALTARFNPAKFDADSWAQLAEEAGCRWINITTKHHDGFALWNSKVADFDMGATPFWKTGRDLLWELADACKRHNLKLAFYYSQWQDWDHPNGGRADLTHEILKDRRCSVYIEQKAIPQMKELLTNYGNIFMVWYDTPQLISPKQSQDFCDFTRQLQPGALICNRIGCGFGDFWSLSDTRLPDDVLFEPWECCMLLGPSWSWHKPPYETKDPREVIRRLSTIVSRGGNLQLNIGPAPDGTLPISEVTVLRQLGRWLQYHGEAIYGTRSNPFLNQRFVCTWKPGRLYVHMHEWPPDGLLRISGLNNKVEKAWLLSLEHKTLPLNQDADGNIILELPQEAPDKFLSIVALAIEGEPKVETKLPSPNAAGIIRVPSSRMMTLLKQFAEAKKNHIDVKNNQRACVMANVRINEPGRYRIVVEQAAVENDGKRWWIRMNNQLLQARVVETGHLNRFMDLPVGEVCFDQSGIYSWILRPTEHYYRTKSQTLFHVRAIRFEPTE